MKTFFHFKVRYGCKQRISVQTAILTLAFLFSLPSAPARATDGLRDSYCAGKSYQAFPGEVVWHLDSGSIQNALTGSGVSVEDVRNLFESTLRTWATSSRARVRHRMSNLVNETCTVGDFATKSCMAFRTNAQDLLGCGKASAPFAHAGCNSTGACSVTFCRDNIPLLGQEQTVYTTLVDVLFHELGHTRSLQHLVLTSSGECTSALFTDCTYVDSDGCDGELMCGTTANSCGAPQVPSLGDSNGVRRYFSPTNTTQHDPRNLFASDYGAPSGTPPLPVRAQIPGLNTIFQASIDCAESVFPDYPCAVVRVEKISSGASRVRLNGLSGYSAPAVWTSNPLLHTTTIPVDSQPDVALNYTGSVAYLLITDPHTQLLRLRTINMLNGSWVSDHILPIKSIGDGPRIAYAAESGYLLIVARGSSSADIYRYNPASSPPDFVEYYSTPTGELKPQPISQISTFGVFHRFYGPVDLDCHRVNDLGIWKDICLFAGWDAALSRVGRVSSYAFSMSYVFGQPKFNIVALNGGWNLGQAELRDLNGVSSVLVAPNRTVVSSTRAAFSSTSRQNSLISNHSTYTVSTNVGYRYVANDAQPCAGTSAAGGDQSPQATLVGGESLAWCKVCDGSRIVGVTWGLTPGEAVCY